MIYDEDTYWYLRAESTTDSATPPSSLHLHYSPISNASQRRARRVDPAGGRCLIENVDGNRGVEYFHCVPRSLTSDSDLLTRLEWYWGMEYFTLNLDTRYNIFPCGADLFFMFDQSVWTLLPEEAVIQQFYDSLELIGDQRFADRQTFPDFEDETFKYRLFPLSSKMNKMPIIHQDIVPDQYQALSPDNFTTHVYPFPNLPLVTSHILPQFVIFDAGRKLKSLPLGTAFNILDGNESLQQLAKIYDAWLRPIPANALDDENFNVPYNPDEYHYDGDSQVDDDQITFVGRYRQRKHTHVRGSPKRKRRKLTGKVLYEHRRLEGKEGWNAETIRSWSEKCDKMSDTADSSS